MHLERSGTTGRMTISLSNAPSHLTQKAGWRRWNRIRGEAHEARRDEDGETESKTSREEKEEEEKGRKDRKRDSAWNRSALEQLTATRNHPLDLMYSALQSF